MELNSSPGSSVKGFYHSCFHILYSGFTYIHKTQKTSPSIKCLNVNYFNKYFAFLLVSTMRKMPSSLIKKKKVTGHLAYFTLAHKREV